MNIEIRTAKPEDAAAACHVLRRSIAECCIEDHRNDEVILAAWLGNKTPETVGSWFLSSANFSVVAMADGKIVGVAVLTRPGKIVLCYVMPEVRFTGVGKALLLAMEARAKEWGIGTLHIISTVTARSFYERNGYLPGGRTTAIFGIEAITFSKKLSPGAYPRHTPCGCRG